jgi:hypothetical protein
MSAIPMVTSTGGPSRASVSSPDDHRNSAPSLKLTVHLKYLTCPDKEYCSA